MGIRKRPDILTAPWEVRIRARGRSPVVEQFATREEASAFDAQAKLQIARGEEVTLPERAEVPVADDVGSLRSVSRIVLRGMRDGTIRNRSGHPYRKGSVVAYEAFLRRHVMPKIGTMPPAALTTADVVRLRDHLVATESAGVAKNAILSLSVLLRWCLERGHVQANVATRLPPLAAGRKRPIRFLSRAEADQLQAAAEEQGIGARVMVALTTGIRRGELEGLTWRDLHADHLAIERQRRRNGDVAATKTGSSRRKVPIGPTTLARLQRHWEEQGRPGLDEPMFGPEDTPAWQATRAALPAPAPRWHDLRHTAATHFLAAGVRIHEVAELLGHSSPQLVIRLYGHALPEEVSLAGVVLDAWRAQDPVTAGAQQQGSPLPI